MSAHLLEASSHRFGRRRWPARWINLLAGLSLLPVPAAALDPAAARGMDVLRYDAHIELDVDAGSIRGRETIRMLMVVDDARSITFDAGGLAIDGVSERGAKLGFERSGHQLIIALAGPSHAGDRHDIEIEYHGSPRQGLEFHADRGEAYTIFSTSQWLVCVDAPDERASLDLELVLPPELVSVGNGEPGAKAGLADGRGLHRWRQAEPVPSYLFGFAAGRYIEVAQRGDGARWHSLATTIAAADLRRIFADTGDMLRFFGDRGGRRFRGTYRQALVSETIGQEMAGFALMSEDYGREVLADPTAESLIAHEVAHQWWGNGVTNRDWGHFWLNEGFATFMTAAYMQHRFGDTEYQKRVDGWLARLRKLRAAGKDRPLVFDAWRNPTSDDRAVVYQKGAYVLHLLRMDLGEAAFWRGLRAYTRTYHGRSVTTDDFRRAMEKSSGRDLSSFFQRWVTGNDGQIPVDGPGS